jgi:alpha-beta hydrolase superfamily lysophospholipase
MQTFEYQSTDGTTIAAYRWPVTRPRAIVQIAHGGAEHAGRYQALAEALNNADYSVYAEDHRGHGRTAQLNQGPGKVGPENAYVRISEDVTTLSGIAASENPGLPLFLMGHSLGSLVCQRILLQHSDSYQGAILSGSPDIHSVAAARELVAAEAQRVGRDEISEVLEQAILAGFSSAIPDAETEQDWLSRDREQVQRYIDDPLCGFPLCTGAWLDLIDAMLCTADEATVRTIRPDLPIYIFSGEADPVHSQWQAISRLHDNYSHAGLTDILVRSYPGGRHEMLNETNRQQVVEELLAWLDKHTP